MIRRAFTHANGICGTLLLLQGAFELQGLLAWLYCVSGVSLVTWAVARTTHG